MTLYRIRDWPHLFENNRTRELKKLDWIPVPNKHDGDGFTDLISRPNGPALFGAWILILQLASKCDPRGTLIRNPASSCGNIASKRGVVPMPHTAATISRITRCPEDLIQHCLEVLTGEIGWIDSIDMETWLLENPAPDCGKVTDTPPLGDRTSRVARVAKRSEANGSEGKGREAAAAPANGSKPAAAVWPLFAAAVRNNFQSTDDRLIEEVVCLAQGVYPAITDPQLADAIPEATRQDQRSGALYRITVPEVIRSWRRRTEANHR